MSLSRLILLLGAVIALMSVAGAVVVPKALTEVTERLPLAQCGRLEAMGELWRARCYQTAMHRMLTEDGPGAVADIDRIAAAERPLFGMCHQAMHIEGRIIGRQLGSNAEVQQAMGLLPDQAATCSAGLAHGMYEGYVEAHGFDASNRAALHLMCGLSDGRIPRADCVHGLGHAAARHYELDVAKTSAFCSDLPAPDGGDCLSAVLMSQVEGERFDGGPLARMGTARELMRFCDGLSGGERIYCYRWVPLVSSFRPQLGETVIRDVCESARPGSGERHACAVGIGRTLPDLPPQPPCERLADPADRAACTYGVIVALGINDASVSAADMARSCPKLDGASAAGCWVAIGRMSATRASRREQHDLSMCPSAHRRSCRLGADLVDEPLDYSEREHATLAELTRVNAPT